MSAELFICFLLVFIVFYAEMVHKQWLKAWFLTSQVPILSGRINFVPFLTTWKNCFPKIPMKYSKNGQKFAMSKNTSNMLFETCWTLCKKPHYSTWSRSRYTFFWMTRYSWLRKWYNWFISHTLHDNRNKKMLDWSIGWKIEKDRKQNSCICAPDTQIRSLQLYLYKKNLLV